MTDQPAKPAVPSRRPGSAGCRPPPSTDGPTRRASRASSRPRPRSPRRRRERPPHLPRLPIGDLVAPRLVRGGGRTSSGRAMEPRRRTLPARRSAGRPGGPARDLPRPRSRWTRCAPRSPSGAPAAPGLAPTEVAGARADGLLAVGAGRVRPSARGPGARGARPGPRPRLRLPVPADRRPRPTRPPPAPWTPTSSWVPSTASMPRRSRPASSPPRARTWRSAVCGAIGALKGPLHGGAPAEVVDQLNEVGTPERAEQWVRRRPRPR